MRTTVPRLREYPAAARAAPTSTCTNVHMATITVFAPSSTYHYAVQGIVDIRRGECKEAHTDTNVQRRSADVVGVGDGIGGGGGGGGG